MTAKKNPETPASFEKALERLEAIVSEMESGQVPLDRMLADFEEGTKLVDYCTKTLNGIERKIEQLVRKENGEVAAEPFEPGAADRAGTTP